MGRECPNCMDVRYGENYKEVRESWTGIWERGKGKLLFVAHPNLFSHYPRDLGCQHLHSIFVFVSSSLCDVKGHLLVTIEQPWNSAGMMFCERIANELKALPYSAKSAEI